MRRPAVYSRSRSSSVTVYGADAESPPPEAPAVQVAPPDGIVPSPDTPATPTEAARRLSRAASVVAGARRIALPLLTVGALAVAAVALWHPVPPRLTQDDIDAAVRHTLEKSVLPSAFARAAQKVGPSVVRVASYGKADKKKQGRGYREKEEGEIERGIGTGVVIVDKGVILTNLHVVAGADHIRVTFADGLETTATVTGMQPEHDLAVLQAHKIPDDLEAATLRSTDGLRPGDEVLAIGFPFGIGPSVSAGIVSGLKREFQSPEGKRQLSNLIQFDAAANPGNSGGPLVTMEGEVVGIVTAILNPTQARTFLGIGFAVPIENAAAAAGMPPF
ncbi:S1C family serine protease [Xylophilus ampelinus]|uniref:Trypsin-like peptidase n=1 Tax=Xylophilus ampelinus TaxID=54067 RepID=A0A318SEF1_9BURK|nr:trypsin-like peptidase domain-containing protein [Xylophilus ampelinus]MCS4511335.1 trypsin-like peptidase domain-containing protein [Xylophilus ampelinus]PYE74909.1 trypsin-like peptidase [Xylophilus ampelinus]